VLEVERTYQVDDGFTVPRFDRAAGPSGADRPSGADAGLRSSGARTVELVATYYDTEDLRLARSRVTLRRRTGGKDAGWHLKLPAGRDREEIQRPLGRPHAIPAELVGLARSRTRGVALGPVVELRTTRHLMVLTDPAGNKVEVADDTVTATRLGATGRQVEAGTPPDAGPTSVRWREVEAELLEGSEPAVLDAVGSALLAAGARPADWQSKLARALATTRPAAGSTGSGSTGPGTDRGAAPTAAGDVPAVTDYIAAQVEAIVALDPLVRLGRDDAVHAMRVATRRLRSTLHSFGELYEPDVSDGLEEDLRELAAVLGEVRDREVLHARFAAALADQPADVLADVPAETLAHRLVPGRRTAGRAVVAALDAPPHLALLDRLETLTGPAALTTSGATADRTTLLELAAATWRQLARRMRRLQIRDGRLPDTAADVDMHRARKAAKRARYAGEALVALAGEPAELFVDATKQLQQLLGDHQDSVAAREVLVAARRSGFPAGLLYRDEQVRAAAARLAVPAGWKAAHRRKLRRWLR